MTRLASHRDARPEAAQTEQTEQAEEFRRAMSHVAGPVAVVTTGGSGASGAPAGSTVSAFVSLSMDPPMLLVSLARGSRLLSLLPTGSTAGVNVLGSHQADLARRFAAPHPDRFAGVAWHTRTGAPALAGTHAWVALRVASRVPAGDHVLVLGDVLEASVDPDVEPGAGPVGPLTYHRRSFGTHHAH